MEWIRAKRPSLGLDLTPLIDCVFQLLIFFMLTSVFTSSVIKVSLPKAVAQDTQAPHPAVISATAEGLLYFNGQPVTMDALPMRLKRLAQESPASQVRFEGDEHLSYDLVMRVMDVARQAGITHLQLGHAPVAERELR